MLRFLGCFSAFSAILNGNTPFFKPILSRFSHQKRVDRTVLSGWACSVFARQWRGLRCYTGGRLSDGCGDVAVGWSGPGRWGCWRFWRCFTCSRRILPMVVFLSGGIRWRLVCRHRFSEWELTDLNGRMRRRSMTSLRKGMFWCRTVAIRSWQVLWSRRSMNRWLWCCCWGLREAVWQLRCCILSCGG